MKQLHRAFPSGEKCLLVPTPIASPPRGIVFAQLVLFSSSHTRRKNTSIIGAWPRKDTILSNHISEPLLSPGFCVALSSCPRVLVSHVSVSSFYRVSVSLCCSDPLFLCSRVLVSLYPRVRVSQCSSVRVSPCSSVPLLQCSRVPVLRCSRVPCPRVRVSPCPHVLVHSCLCVAVPYLAAVSPLELTTVMRCQVVLSSQCPPTMRYTQGPQEALTMLYPMMRDPAATGETNEGRDALP
ncbi:hypothetical protein E2C01_003638 [Portunus trituberculatus]|uniref:Uncharacterized protein n=1 Tax=Portunus trituberculatus TaxID=210409 RepID=A0A5B7CPA9_PORTR|nr:hypothetical protein [Portunus trituberculatus]